MDDDDDEVRPVPCRRTRRAPTRGFGPCVEPQTVACGRDDRRGCARRSPSRRPSRGDTGPLRPRGAVAEPDTVAPAPRSPSAALRHPIPVARTTPIQPDVHGRDKVHKLLTIGQQHQVFTFPHVRTLDTCQRRDENFPERVRYHASEDPQVTPIVTPPGPRSGHRQQSTRPSLNRDERVVTRWVRFARPA